MKATMQFANIQVEVEGPDQKTLFGALASVSEVFSETCCGLCKSTDIRPAVRNVPDGKKVHQYYEMVCNKCRAKLAFGQSTDTTTLFPKRRLKNGQPDMENGDYGDHKGWHKYVPDKK